MLPRRIARLALQSCLIFVVAQVATACGADAPLPPTVAADTVASGSPPAGFPEPTRPATIYVGADSLYQYPGENGLLSRYVFYDDDTFALQFYSAARGPFEYKGRVLHAGSTLDLRFDAQSSVGPWIATGSLRADTLSVSYGVAMEMSDFQGGAYIRSR